MRLNEYASTRRTRGSYKIPTSVQKSIPIDEIYADGTWRSGEVYSQMWSVSDINYAMQSDDKKQDILAKMGRIYSNIPTDCWAQLCIVSQRMDEISFERDVLYHRANDGLDAYRVERNRLMKAYAKEIGNVKQQKYLILSTNKQNSKDARERLNQVQRNMLGELSNIGCKVCALDNNARLEVLHNFFRIGEETHFQFDFDNCTRLGQDFRDAIAPDAMRFCKDHIEIDDSYAKCMTIAEIVAETNADFGEAINEIVAAHPECSESTIEYDYEDGHTWASYWPEVLAVFAVHTNLNSDSDVVVIDEGKKLLIQNTFWSMHQITSAIETVTTTPEPTEDETQDKRQRRGSYLISLLRWQCPATRQYRLYNRGRRCFLHL